MILVRLQRASQPSPPPCYFLHLLFLLACYDFKPAFFALTNFCLIEKSSPLLFCKCRQLAWRKECQNCLVYPSTTAESKTWLTNEGVTPRRKGKDKGVLWFWVSERGAERRLQGFANRSNKDGWMGRFGNLLCAFFVQRFTKLIRSLYV